MALTKNITELGKLGIMGHSPGDIWSVSAPHLMIKILPQVQSGKMTNRELKGGERGRERKIEGGGGRSVMMKDRNPKAF